MRLWSLHPRALDSRGLVACWREALLAQKVLQGTTKGFREHPQLDRFKAYPSRAAPTPLPCIGAYLWVVAEEAQQRGYKFNRDLIVEPPDAVVPLIDVAIGQIDYERWLLAAKRRERGSAPEGFGPADVDPTPHPLFQTVPGPIEPWERVLPAFG
ncbi:pyrimidine dimer DNA glycosylase/endonuclease V [Mycobacterium sp. AMU20-3851]|uniref:pyrimidine dimer DNA glycosylase/endonuclease V n=1 Tax=Mycobacterium sp. AMU20-3851 TaxID=3122055 RepID=UPI003754346F